MGSCCSVIGLKFGHDDLNETKVFINTIEKIEIGIAIENSDKLNRSLFIEKNDCILVDSKELCLESLEKREMVSMKDISVISIKNEDKELKERKLTIDPLLNLPSFDNNNNYFDYSGNKRNYPETSNLLQVPENIENEGGDRNRFSIAKSDNEPAFGNNSLENVLYLDNQFEKEILNENSKKGGKFGHLAALISIHELNKNNFESKLDSQARLNNFRTVAREIKQESSNMSSKLLELHKRKYPLSSQGHISDGLNSFISRSSLSRTLKTDLRIRNKRKTMDPLIGRRDSNFSEKNKKLPFNNNH